MDARPSRRTSDPDSPACGSGRARRPLRDQEISVLRAWGGAAFLPETFSATAARMSAFRAGASISSPSWMSMARRAFPSRLELKRREGAFREAALEKDILKTFLHVSPVQTIPMCDQTGGPHTFNPQMMT